MTRDQVIVKYNSREIGNEICDSKLRDPELKRLQTKPHPDAPQNEALSVCEFVHRG